MSDYKPTRESDEDGGQFGYMCTIDFECELGHAADGTRIYPSVKALKSNHRCWNECGIVKVKTYLYEVVCEAQMPDWNSENPVVGDGW